MKYLLKFLGAIWGVFFLTFFALSLYWGHGGEIPLIAQKYVSSFQHYLGSFLTSIWFLMFFIVMWFSVPFSLSKQSGWQDIAKKYADNKPTENLKFKAGNAYIGKIRYNATLKVAADESGLYLRVLFLFKFGHKNLFIPWHEISSISLQDGLFSDKAPLVLKKLNNLIPHSKCLDISLNKYPEQRISIANFEYFKKHIPENLGNGI